MKRIAIISALSLLIATCREPYVSPVKLPNLGYLVVEGAINSGQGSTSIFLSRTTTLDNAARVSETGAQVWVEDQSGATYHLTEAGGGVYNISALNLDNSHKYRLRIVANEKEYVSDYVGVNTSPPIDSLTWSYDADGVHIAASTHDPTGQAKYFQWDYTEIWEIHSDYVPNAIYNPYDIYSVVFFNPGAPLAEDSSGFRCWKTDTSRNIIIGSSIKYAVDTLSQVVANVQHGSEKINIIYSINVRQFSYTQEGYDFLQKMKKNTEQLGSVFDAQPSELQGNIHSQSDPTELVVGYVSVCDVQEKRTFIPGSQLPGWNYSSGCYLLLEDNEDSVIKQKNYLKDGVTAIIVPFQWQLRTNLPPPFGKILTFTAAPVECVDCSVRGTKTKPPFWPY